MLQRLTRPSMDQTAFVTALAVVILGSRLPTARYLSPESGLGYALGIAGGSMMLLLLVYPLRKRFRALAFLGGVPQWFRAHMMLGIAGPICILFHCSFSLGATNSNVALVCMVVVSGSGIVGRYFYSRIHHGLYGRKAGLAELQESAQVLKSQNPALPMMPELIARIEAEERRLLDARVGAHLALATPIMLATRVMGVRLRLRRYMRGALHAAAVQSSTLAAERDRIERVVRAYIERRLTTTRRVAEFRAYERLFSLWHVLHMPLFFMLIAAGVAHVIAVHVY